MVPIAILAYAVYLVRSERNFPHTPFKPALTISLQGLKLSQGYLSHEKYKILAEERTALLEEEVREWRVKQSALTATGNSQLGKGTSNAEMDAQADVKSNRWWSLGLL